MRLDSIKALSERGGRAHTAGGIALRAMIQEGKSARAMVPRPVLHIGRIPRFYCGLCDIRRKPHMQHGEPGGCVHKKGEAFRVVFANIKESAIL